MWRPTLLKITNKIAQEVLYPLIWSQFPGFAQCAFLAHFLVRCLGASDPRRAHVSHHRSQNSLNIDFTGIHALEHLFSIKIYEQRDQYEIFRTILKFWVLIGPTLVTPLGCVASMSMIDDDCCVASASRRSLMQHNHDPSLSAVMHGLILLD